MSEVENRTAEGADAPAAAAGALSPSAAARGAASPPGSGGSGRLGHQRHWTHTFNDGTRELRLHSSDDMTPPPARRQRLAREQADEAEPASGAAVDGSVDLAEDAAVAAAVDDDSPAPKAKPPRLSNHEMEDASSAAVAAAPEGEAEAETGSESDEQPAAVATAGDDEEKGEGDEDDDADAGVAAAADENEEDADMSPSHGNAEAGGGAAEDEESGDDDEGDEEAQEEAQHLGLRKGHRPFMQHSPDRPEHEHAHERVTDDEDEAGGDGLQHDGDDEGDFGGGEGAMATNDDDDVDEYAAAEEDEEDQAAEFGEGVVEEDEDAQFIAAEADEDGEDEESEEEEAFAPRPRSSYLFNWKAAPAAPAKPVGGDDDSDAIDLTLSDDDEPPPPPARKATAAAAKHAPAADSSSSGSSSSSSSEGGSPRAAAPVAASSVTITAPPALPAAAALPISDVTPTSPGASPIPDAQFSPEPLADAAVAASVAELPVAAAASSASAAEVDHPAAALALPKPLFSSPLSSSPHVAFASRLRGPSRDRSPGRGGAEKASFMSPPHRPLRAPAPAPMPATGGEGNGEVASAAAPHAAAGGALAAEPSPARPAAASPSQQHLSSPATGRARGRVGIKNWPQPKLYRLPFGLHTALLAASSSQPRQAASATRISYQFESLVPSLEPRERHGDGGGLLSSALISRPASSASFVAAATAAARRAARSTFHALERERLARRAEQLARQELAIANYARRRVQPVEDELSSVLGSLSLSEAAPLTRDSFRAGSLAQRDRFVSTDVSRRMFEAKAAPRDIVEILLSELAEEAARELALETLAHAKKTAPLSEAELKRSSDLLLSPASKRIVDKFNIEITGKELVCLRNLGWLNDEVINFYLELLVERSKRNRAAPPGTVAPSQRDAVHCYSTFFLVKAAGSGNAGYVHKNVARWSRSAKIDVARLDKLLAPVHVGLNHWCCALANLRARRMEYYDSMGGTNDDALKLLRRYVADEVAAHHPELVKEMDVLNWPLVTPGRTKLPQQNNGSDCGVFMLKFMDYASENRPFDFTFRDMPYFRRRIALEIANQQVL